MNAQLKEFVEWDVRNWSCALNFWASHTSHNLADCSALELGSGKGGLSLWLALQGARTLCSDIQPPADDVIQRHKSSGVSDRIGYECIDAKHIPYSNTFDIILFKSILGRIGGMTSQAQAIKEMHRALKPGGELLFAENLTASWLHQVLRKRFVQWGTSWRYVSIGEMKEFLSPFSSVEYRTLGVAGTLGRGEAQRDILGLIDQAILNRSVPERWRYIIVGVARK